MAIREEVIKLEKSIISLAMSQSAIVVLYIAMNKFVQTLDKRLKLLAYKEGPSEIVTNFIQVFHKRITQICDFNTTTPYS